MIQQPPNEALGLPHSLREQFSALERRLWKTETILASCLGAAGLILSFLVVFVLDRFVDTPAVLRGLLVLLGLGSMAGAGVWWSRRWLGRRPPPEELAREIQKRHRRFGDRLLGIVELSRQNNLPENVSESLCRAAIAQVAAEAKKMDFAGTVETRPARRWGIGAGVLAGVVLVAAVFMPEAAWNAAARWILPGSSTPRYTFLDVDHLPKELVVPHGEPFELAFGVRYRSFWKPETVRARLENQKEVDTKVSGGRALVKLPGQTQNGVLNISVGDKSVQVEIKPMYRPALRELTADIVWPDYLQRSVSPQKIEQGVLKLLEGSKASLKGTATRDLAWAKMEKGPAADFRVAGPGWQTGPLEFADIDQVAVGWRDVLGLEAKPPVSLRIEHLKDGAPLPEIRDLSPATAMLEDETLKFTMAAKDDYGLLELKGRWNAYDKGQTEGNPKASLEWELAAGSPEKVQLEKEVYFSPKVLKIPAGSTVLMQAVARDYYPNREAEASEIFVIQVLTLADHAALLQAEFAKLAEKLEAITQAQDAVLSETEQVKAMTPEEMQKGKTGEELRQQARDQERNAERLKELAKENTDLIKEALRNKDFDKSSIERMMKLAEAMQKLSQGKMSQAKSSLSNASSQPQNREKETGQALEKEQQALKELQEMQNQMAKESDVMQARNFASRLREISRDQGKVAEGLQEVIPQTIGLPFAKIEEKWKKVLGDFGDIEDRSRDESRVLQKELAVFFHRTQEKPYEEVSDAMEKQKVVEALQKLGTMLAGNQTVSAAENAGQWTETFAKWADMLEKAADDMASSSSSGNGAMSPEMMEMLAKLYQLRQKQEMLRSETRALGQQKLGGQELKERLESLASRQGDLERTRKEIEAKAPPNLQSAMEQIRSAIEDAQKQLQEGKTGEETTGAQSAVIEVVTKILEGMSKSGKGQGMAAMMMGGGGPGGGPGGNPQLKESDAALDPLSGTGTGEGVEPREIVKASGSGAKESPAEYRDALESYYRALDGEGK